MKKILFLLMILVFASPFQPISYKIVGPILVMAADVTLTVTIPEVYAPRASEAFEAQFHCSDKGLNPKQCAEAMWREKIKAIVKAYEKKKAEKEATQSIGTIEVN